MSVRINVERTAVEVVWDQTGDEEVKVYAQGEKGDWHNTSEMANDGHAVLTYPSGFSGESLVEVRSSDGTVVDYGTIEVG